jgi:hypothetical protein
MFYGGSGVAATLITCSITNGSRMKKNCTHKPNLKLKKKDKFRIEKNLNY